MNPIARYLAIRQGNGAEDAFERAFTAVLEGFAEGNTLVRLNPPPAADGRLVIRDDQARAGANAPLVRADDCLWLERIWRKEYQLAGYLKVRLDAKHPLPEYDEATLTGRLEPEQKVAVRHALTHRFTIINGGPGSGKTYTLAHLVAAKIAARPETRIALAAPTGKAAKRMAHALHQAFAASVDVTAAVFERIDEAKTLHRLLGIGGNGEPRYHGDNPLPCDVLIVDEASMLSLELAHALFAALPEDADLILIGDADQLAAVEPGAVLHDLSHQPELASAMITLTGSRRFHGTSGIGQLAGAVGGDAAAVCGSRLRDILTGSGDIRWRDEARPQWYAELYEPFAGYVAAVVERRAPEELYRLFDAYRILCAGHYGAFGVDELNRQMRSRHLRALGEPIDADFYPGQPLMVGANDYTNQLYNGDIGLCLVTAQGERRLYFPDREPIALARLSRQKLQPAYALTIHKAQGSEFDRLALVFDPRQEKGLSRELLYTGITRARAQLDLYAPAAVLTRAAATPTLRSTGLARFLGEGHGS